MKILQSVLRRSRWYGKGLDSEPQNAAEIGEIYKHAAALSLRARNPIVFIPGIMGSKLVDAEHALSVWGDFSRSYADPARGTNRRLIALPMELGVPLDRLASPSEADGSVARARSRRLPFAVSAYADILQTMGVSAGYPLARHRPEYEGSNAFASFEFGYDWRRSLDETAGDLEAFLRMATYFVQAVRGNADPVRFDIVAHSMGGLVLRYYLRYGSQRLPLKGDLPRLTWAGSERVERAVIIGTPNAGSAMSIHRLVNGLPGKPLIHPGYDPFIVGTMPALYQLLPRNRHRPFVDASQPNIEIDLYDPEFWWQRRWGLSDPEGDAVLALQLEDSDSPQKRRETAVEHMGKCLGQAKAFHQAIDAPAKPPESLELHLILGDSVATPAALAGSAADKKLDVCRYRAGDGTVLRSSALLDEREGRPWSQGVTSPIDWSSVAFASANHMALTRDRVVVNNVLYRLLEARRKNHEVF